MKDASDYLLDDPIEILTSISDDCPHRKCDGTGQIWKKDWSRLNKKDEIDENGKLLRAEWIERCECYEQLMKQREIDKKLDLSGIPPIFKDATVRSFQVDIYKTAEGREKARVAKVAAINYVRDFETMREGGKGLYLYSDVKGSGKTRLASSITNALVSQHGEDIVFVKFIDLMAQVRKTFQKDSEMAENDVVESYRKASVLIVDDVAIHTATKFEERILYAIMDYRVERKKVTLFTSNVPIDDLEIYYPGERVSDRINRMALEVHMPEERIRKQEAENENAEYEKMLFG